MAILCSLIYGSSPLKVKGKSLYGLFWWDLLLLFSDGNKLVNLLPYLFLCLSEVCEVLPVEAGNALELAVSGLNLIHVRDEVEHVGWLQLLPELVLILLPVVDEAIVKLLRNRLLQLMYFDFVFLDEDFLDVI